MADQMPSLVAKFMIISCKGHFGDEIHAQFRIQKGEVYGYVRSLIPPEVQFLVRTARSYGQDYLYRRFAMIVCFSRAPSPT